MSSEEVHEAVDYASSNASGTDARNPNTAPIPSYTSAAAANMKAAAADHPASSAAVAHPPSHSSGTPVAPASKGSVVHRTGGTPTAMYVHRGQPNQHPVPTPLPSSTAQGSAAPPRTTWTSRDSGANSAMSSVARRRGSVAQDPLRASAAPARSESLPPAQSSVHRRRDVSQASSTNVCQAVDHHQSSVQRGSPRARSESYTARAANEPASVPPFQLLSAGRPVPELPRELEEAIAAYYVGQLHHLSVSDQERIVYAMVAPRDVKAVMTCLKQQDHVGAASAAAIPPPPGSAHVTPARSRGNGVPAHPVPKNAPVDVAATSNRRRVLQEHHDEHRHTPQQLSSTPEQKAALARFHQHFTVEACAAFLDDALDVCIARRTRCYQEQPQVAKDQCVVLPEEHLFPLYTRAVSSLLYNMTGWTQPEARRLSRLVVSIVHDWMPTVVAQAPPPQEAPRQPHAAPARPPVPMAPRSNAPQRVAVA